MKQLLVALLAFVTLQTMAQEKTFIYEITLYEQYRHQAMWTEKEHDIQKQHIEYLKKLTESGELQMAGIADQGLTNHTGFIILTTENYEKAKQIAFDDPSVKKGMMHVNLRPINIYFKKEDK